jgi:hypothetical protein
MLLWGDLPLAWLALTERMRSVPTPHAMPGRSPDMA